MPSPNDRDAGKASEHTPLLDKSTSPPMSATTPAQQPPAPAASGSSSSAGQKRTPAPSSSKLRIDNTPTWGKPAGLQPRSSNDENLLIFRRAVGINIQSTAFTNPSNLERGKNGSAGIYLHVQQAKRWKDVQYFLLNSIINICHVAQIMVGAALTALGPLAADHSAAITALGAINTVLAGMFALIKGQGLPDRLHKDAVEYSRLQDWIEETDALLAAGIVGRDRTEIGLLVEAAFKKYNAVLASEENNKPDNYVRQQPERSGIDDTQGPSGGHNGNNSDSDTTDGGNAIVHLNTPKP